MESSLAAEVERACRLLESPTPEAMQASAAALETVAGELGARRGSIGIEEARRVRSAARRARLLLELAARFHRRWHDILAGMSGGYTAQGAPSGIVPRGRIDFSG